jgi:hypothetical protein
VLASDETDYYLEQALMSVTSLKMRMPDAFVSLLIDDATEKTLIDKRKNISELVNELKIVEIDARFNKKARSRWLKTSMRRHITGDFLYIDCDTVICDDLSDIENVHIDLGAVLDFHVLLNNSVYKESIQNDSKILGFDFPLLSDKYFNSGVIFCKDIPECHIFFDEWHKLWLMGVSKKLIDQPSFNQANVNYNNTITEMNGIWNCQIILGGLIFLANAKIIHIFTSFHGDKPYTLTDPALLQNIKELGVVNSEIESFLMHPRTNFHLNTYLLTDKKTIKIIRSSIFPIIKQIYDWKFAKFIYKPIKKIIKSISGNTICL